MTLALDPKSKHGPIMLRRRNGASCGIEQLYFEFAPALATLRTLGAQKRTATRATLTSP